MTTKKPWKPYDVEQAKVEILAEAVRRQECAKDAIDEVALAAVKRLEEQAKTFAQLPKDVGSLFVESSAVMIGAFEPSPFPYFDSPIISDILVHGSFGQHTVVCRANVSVPKKKHRVLVFFVLEE